MERSEESETNHPEAEALLPEGTSAVPDRTRQDEALPDEGDERLLRGWPALSSMFKEVKQQYRMGGPLSVNLFFIYSIQIVTMAFLGRCGTTRLAAASLAMAIVNSLGTLFFIGLCGATDTLASQAYGAEQFNRLAIIFQRTCLFLATHCIPVVCIVLSAPYLLAWAGQSAEVSRLMKPYILISLPGLFLDVVDRPMNRILVAQQITRPQMWISGIVLVLHTATNFFLFSILGPNYLATGAAYSLSRFYYFSIQAAWIAWRGLGPRVWGTPDRKALSNWRTFASIAYPSAVMRCMESFCYSGMTIVAGLLPDGDTAVSAIGLAFNIYGTLFMAFLGVAVSVSARVGNGLGAGRPGAARLAALTAASAVPVIWVPMALVLCLPLSQAALVRVFVPPAEGRLAKALGNLLYIVAGLELADGMQTVLTGVITGVGKQLRGAQVNFVSFYLVAVPLALLLAFKGGFWVYGLYLGLGMGPLIQAVMFGWLVMSITWPSESELALERAREDM